MLESNLRDSCLGVPDEKATDITINSKPMAINLGPGHVPSPSVWNVYDLATSQRSSDPVVVGAASIVFASTYGQHREVYM